MLLLSHTPWGWQPIGWSGHPPPRQLNCINGLSQSLLRGALGARGCIHEPLIGTGLALAALLVATPAQAFLLVATDQGVPTRWHQQCVPWKMSERLNNGFSWSETHALTTAAFQTWDELEGTYIRFEDQGTSSLDTVSLDHGVGENIIIWHGDGQWPYALHVVGLTSLTYDTDTARSWTPTSR